MILKNSKSKVLERNRMTKYYKKICDDVSYKQRLLNIKETLAK